MADEDFDDFDDDGIEHDATGYQAPVRSSQRRAARKLTPWIERVLAINPAIGTSDVRRILERNRRSGALPKTVTFNREFAKICGEVRARIKGSPSSKRPAPPAKRGSSPVATQAVQRAPVTNTPVNIVELPPSHPPAAPPAHPLKIYAGSFGGKVFTHGPAIRDFFSAIEKRRDDSILKTLADRIVADAPSRARLADLDPKDRSILEAARALT